MRIDLNMPIFKLSYGEFFLALNGLLAQSPFLIVAIIACNLLALYPAKADYPVPMAAVQCDAAHNRVLLRFGELNAYVPPDNTPLNKDDLGNGLQTIPTSLANKWSGIPYQFDGSCKFHNGEVVAVSILAGTVGEEVEDNNADTYFKLTINGHPAYEFRDFDSGSPYSQGPSISAVEYDGKFLLECESPPQDQSGNVIGPSSCHDVSDRLSASYKYSNPEEQFAWGVEQKLRSSLSPFCKSLNFSPNGNVQKGIDSVKFGPNMGQGAAMTETDIDIFNDHHVTKVFRIPVIAGLRDRPEYTGGELFTFGDNNQLVNEFLDQVQSGAIKNYFDFPQTDDQIKGTIYLEMDDPWRGQWGSVENQIFYLDGRYYIYSKYSDANYVPSAKIIEVKSDGSINTVCTYP